MNNKKKNLTSTTTTSKPPQKHQKGHNNDDKKTKKNNSTGAATTNHSTIPLVDNSACCIIPPKSVWDQIDAIRAQYDKSYGRWPVHMNLFFPFIPAKHFAEGAQEIGKLLQNIPPFEIELNEIQYNEDSKYMFLVPKIIIGNSTTNQSQFGQIVNQIIKVYPQCRTAMTGKVPSDLSNWIPHLTLGQFPKNEMESVRSKLQSNWEPIRFQVDQISFISRQGRDDPFKIGASVMLGV